MHFKNARNASVYAVFRAFFTQSLAKLRIFIRCCQMLHIQKIAEMALAASDFF